MISAPTSRKTGRWVAALLGMAAMIGVTVVAYLRLHSPIPPLSATAPPPLPEWTLLPRMTDSPSALAKAIPSQDLPSRETSDEVAKVIVRVEGDLNGDGIAGTDDETALVHSLISCSPAPEGADLRPDGVFDVADRLVMKRLLPPRLPGDLNKDGVVDIADRQVLARYLATGLDSPEPEVADLNADGTIDIADLRMLTREIARAH